MKARRAKPKRKQPSTTDGRAERSARTRAAIALAVYELVRARGEIPSVEEVAERAGVGERTVFRQFNDVETLARSVHERLFPEVMELARPSPPTGVLEEDLRSLVARRARVFEHVAPFRRASRGHRERSPFMSEQDAAMSLIARASVEAVVLPHLDDDDRAIVEVVDVLLSFEAWDRLRSVQRLSVAEATRVLEKGALALLRRPSSR
ncbi:MAG: TetR/AcrR family transcriptional regulator [Myxococcales bacterium]|nr:TetR/AcrR family transcriptional regulator [Myxococcales bacterium]